MDTNAILVGLVATIAVLGFYGIRSWWLAPLAGIIALNFPTYALGAFGVVLAVFSTWRFIHPERSRVVDSKIIDARKGDDDVWTV